MRAIDPSLRVFLVRLIAVAFLLNFVWEMAQMPLYEGMPLTEIRTWGICLRATAGDVAIVVGIWLVGWGLFRSSQWMMPARLYRTIAAMASGAAIAIIIEVVFLRTGRWAYSSLMPTVPGVDTGVAPLLQLILLPVLSMWLASRGVARLGCDGKEVFQ